MIAISVETDEEEAAVRDALESGALREAIGHPFRITREWRTVGGSGSTSTVHYNGNSAITTFGGSGGTGTAALAGQGDGQL